MAKCGQVAMGEEKRVKRRKGQWRSHSQWKSEKRQKWVNAVINEKKMTSLKQKEMGGGGIAPCLKE